MNTTTLLLLYYLLWTEGLKVSNTVIVNDILWGGKCV